METTKRQSPVLPLSIILITTLFVTATFMVPVVEEAVNPIATHWRTAAGMASMVLFIGASITFLRGLKSFKSELRVAYRLIAYGIMAFSLALIQLVIWGMLDLWESEWAASGSGLLPYVITAALIYVGARKFAQLLNIKSVLNSFWTVFGATLGIAVAMYFAAQAWVTYDLEGTDVYITVGALCSSYLLAAALLAYKIFRSIGAYYQNSMRWLFIGLAALCIAAWHETINTFWFNNGDGYTDYGFYLIPWVLTGLVLVFASYQFRKLPELGQTEAGVKAETTDRDYVDSILAVADLVSKPQEVDDILDELRLVTSGLRPGQTLSSSDKQRLIKTYRQLESYLAQKDPLRTFTKDEVLSHVTPAFRGLVEKAA